MQKITCAHCLRERSPNLMHSCRLCGNLYCIGHKMPERHDCTVNVQRKYLTMGTEVHEEESRRMSKAYARAKQINDKRKKRLKEKKAESNEEEEGLMAWLRNILGGNGK
ncbi:MAG: hypothetical protein GY852_08340 [bacterium]|nr:hypothetical protein [bacterium]